MWRFKDEDIDDVVNYYIKQIEDNIESGNIVDLSKGLTVIIHRLCPIHIENLERMNQTREMSNKGKNDRMLLSLEVHRQIESQDTTVAILPPQGDRIFWKGRKVEAKQIAEALMENENISREEFEAIFPPPFEKKSGTPQAA